VINGIRIASLAGSILNTDIVVNYVSKEDSKTPQIKEIEVTALGDLTSYPRGFFDQEQSDIATIINYKVVKIQ
jgi:predicted ATPase